MNQYLDLYSTIPRSYFDEYQTLIKYKNTKPVLLDHFINFPLDLDISIYNDPIFIVEENELIIEGKSDFTLNSIPQGVTSLRIINCHRFQIGSLRFTRTQEGQPTPKFSLTLVRCEEFILEKLFFSARRNAIVLQECKRFGVSAVNARELEGYGIIAFDCCNFWIKNSAFEHCLASGIYLLGSICNALLESVKVSYSTGYFNWDAGIHINHCSPNVILADIPEKTHEPLSILDKTKKPKRIEVVNCVFSNNRSQGVYLEGAEECLVHYNLFFKNNKEGICFDWGTRSCLFTNNNLSDNGRRQISDQEAMDDFVTDFPVLQDGTSSCKLPGISIDNGAFNIISNNSITYNHGGGIKCVRSAVGNLFQGNIFYKNNLFENQIFPNFHDILFLSLGSRGGEFDGGTQLLDLKQSAFNLETGNFFRSRLKDRVKDPDQLNFSENQLSITCSAFECNTGDPASNVFEFGSCANGKYSNLVFQSDGVIKNSLSCNEYKWIIKESENYSELIILSSPESGERITSKFKIPHKGNLISVLESDRPTESPHYLRQRFNYANCNFKNRPSIFINSIPKSGTYFIKTILQDLGYHWSGLHLGDDCIDDYRSCSKEMVHLYPTAFRHYNLPPSLISSLFSGNQVSVGHIFNINEMHKMVDSGIQVFNLVRNIRDILISSCNFFKFTQNALSNISEYTNFKLLCPEDSLLSFFLLENGLLLQNILNRVQLFIDVESSFQLLRYEELIIKNPTPSSMQFSCITGISEEEILGAIKRVSGITTETRRNLPKNLTLVSKKDWSPSVETLFINSGLYELNRKLGYE